MLKLQDWSDFARHYFRNLGWFLFLRLLRCFSSPGSPPRAYVFSTGYPYGWVSPFGNPRIKACLAAPRGLSQPTTSFIACNRQGIHDMHLFTWLYNFGDESPIYLASWPVIDQFTTLPMNITTRAYLRVLWLKQSHKLVKFNAHHINFTRRPNC